MDPVTILSVAAASFQFAELAVKSVSRIAKMSQDLKDIPKRLRDQLNDTEASITQMRDFSTDLMTNASLSSLEPSRLGSLTSAVNNWMTTAANLELTLHNVLNPSTASKSRKWKVAFASLRQADDIELQIFRLQSLKNEIWGELLQTLLASQLQIKSGILDGETNISSKLQATFQRLQDEQLNHKRHLVATIQEEGTNTRTTLDNCAKSMNANTWATIDNLTTSINASFGQLSLQASRDQEVVVGRINAHVSEEFRALRALVSSSTSWNHAFIDDGPETSNMRPPLVRGGSLLTAEDDSVEIFSGGNAPAAPDPFIPFHHRNWHANQSPPPCSCPLRMKRVWQVSKGLRLRYEAVRHVSPCQQSLEMKQFRSVSIRIELPRFMGPTMEVSVAMATVGTGYALSETTFKCFPTVKRLASPIFAELDGLQNFFSRKGKYLKLELIDIEALRCDIRDLPRRLQRITATGAGSCRDKDEVGNTLLLVCAMIYRAISPSFSENSSQETVYLMICLEHRLPEVSAELTQLLDFLRTVGLDISGTGVQLCRIRHEFSGNRIEGYEKTSPFSLHVFGGLRMGPATAQSLAMVFAQEAPESFPISSYFKDFDLEGFCSIDSNFPVSAGHSAYARSRGRRKAALFFRLNQALASELGSLEGALARRDMVELKSILRSRSFDPHEYKRPLILADLELSAFQLALDWQEGIEELLTKFAPTRADIEFAIHIDTPLSLRMLKTLWHRMRESLDYDSVFEILLKASVSAQNQVIELMQQSRLKLHQFAMFSLNDDEKDKLCLTSQCAADWRTSEVWATLIMQRCGVPLRYEPMPKDFLFSLLLGFNFRKYLFQQTVPLDGETTSSMSELLQRYCDMGLLEVNCQRIRQTTFRRMQGMETPFLAFLETYAAARSIDSEGVAWLPRFTEICLWFLNNGASAQDFEDCQPNLLFFLARFIAAWRSWRSKQDDDDLRCRIDLYRQRNLWTTALERCSADQSDACQCFCSVAGCLPSRLFLQPENPHRYRSWTPRAILDKRLFLWFELCQLSEDQEARYVEDAVRLEVFTRLGMTHTCCAHAKEIWQSISWYYEFDSDDIKEVQLEESELKDHLHLIMEAYVSFSRDFKDWDAALSRWWITLGGVLPDLSGLSKPSRFNFRRKEEYERAMHSAEEARAALEAQTLQSNGYEGMDFMDVIKLHFCKYLQDRTVGIAE